MAFTYRSDHITQNYFNSLAFIGQNCMPSASIELSFLKALDSWGIIRYSVHKLPFVNYLVLNFVTESLV